MDVRWKHPWTSIVCGPTGCGKTIFVKTFLRHLTDMSDVAFERILFYYAEWQEAYRQLQHEVDSLREESTLPKCEVGKRRKNIIEFREGLPRPDDYSHDPFRPKLLIIDDLMRESSSCDVIVDLFTKGSHHKNLSVILISQNLFYQGRGQQDISLNTNYIVVFKNSRDRAQIRLLTRQVYPNNPKFIEEAYYDATLQPQGNLLLYLKQSTPDEYRFRACIFPTNSRHYVYDPLEISYKILRVRPNRDSRVFAMSPTESAKRRSCDRVAGIALRSIGQKNVCLLKALYYLTKKQRISFLRAAGNDFIACICEYAYNTLKGNVPLDQREKKNLSKYKSVLRNIASKRGNWNAKRKIIVQRGGFLSCLIGPILGAILSRVIGGARN